MYLQTTGISLGSSRFCVHTTNYPLFFEYNKLSLRKNFVPRRQLFASGGSWHLALDVPQSSALAQQPTILPPSSPSVPPQPSDQSSLRPSSLPLLQPIPSPSSL